MLLLLLHACCMYVAYVQIPSAWLSPSFLFSLSHKKGVFSFHFSRYISSFPLSFENAPCARTNRPTTGDDVMTSSVHTGDHHPSHHERLLLLSNGRSRQTEAETTIAYVPWAPTNDCFGASAFISFEQRLCSEVSEAHCVRSRRIRSAK